MYRVIIFLFIITLFSCNSSGEKATSETTKTETEVQANLRYGIDLNAYELRENKINRGDTFGKILEKNGIDYPQVYKILQAIKGKVNVRKLTIGKAYSLFYSKDSITTPEYFVYHPGPRMCFLNKFGIEFGSRKWNATRSPCWSCFMDNCLITCCNLY